MSVGLLALEDHARIDFARLRAARRARLFAAMEDDDLDVLALGRPANVHYASGARQLWISGSRGFAPSCVVVRATRAVHLLTVADVGVPPEIPHEQLYCTSWDPLQLVGSVAAVPGVAPARRLGTDAMTPMFRQLLGGAAPLATFVDASGTLRIARERKTIDEMECIRAAVAIAEAGLDALRVALQPGVSERELLGRYGECVARLGAPTSASEAVACITGRADPILRDTVSDRRAARGDLVVLQAGALYAGYEGGISRTAVVDDAAMGDGQATDARVDDLASGCRAGLDAMIAACRAGNSGADVRRAAPAPSGAPVPLAYGIGLGVESPLIADGIGDDDVFVVDSVLAVQCWMADAGVGGYLERDLVRITDGEPEILTRG